MGRLPPELEKLTPGPYSFSFERVQQGHLYVLVRDLPISNMEQIENHSSFGRYESVRRRAS